MHLETVVKYIRRSPYQALAAGLVLFLTFFIISIFAFLGLVSARVVDYFATRPQLTIFFKDQATVEDIMSLKKTIENTGKIAAVKYVSKEDALKIYREQNKNDPLLLELVTADILPASLEVQTTKPEYLSEIASLVKGTPNIEEIVYQKDVVNSLISIISGLRIIGVGIIGVLLLVSTLVIITIIGIKITVRREEIEIMKLLGATDWFIRTPFILEGVFYGFVGSILGFLVALGIFVWSRSFIESFFRGVPIFPMPYVVLLEILGIEILFACFLGALASFVAVVRYLR
jgi:cell division transport system permease protein